MENYNNKENIQKIYRYVIQAMNDSNVTFAKEEIIQLIKKILILKKSLPQIQNFIKRNNFDINQIQRLNRSWTNITLHNDVLSNETNPLQNHKNLNKNNYIVIPKEVL